MFNIIITSIINNYNNDKIKKKFNNLSRLPTPCIKFLDFTFQSHLPTP